MTPLFPSDATLGSILQAFVYAGKLPHAFRYAPFPTKGRLSGDFGEAARLFSEQVLDGATSPDELLQRHTMYPLMGSLLNADVTTQWKAALIDGRRYPHRGVFPNFLSTFSAIRRSRCCPKCVEEDLNKYGVAHWRIPHQIPGLKHCIHHGHVLCDLCKGFRCDAKFANRMGPFQLPSDPCWSCRSKEFEIFTHRRDIQSSGYQAYSDIIVRALQGRAWELRPHTREVVRHFFREQSQACIRDAISSCVSSWSEYSFETLLRTLETSVPESQSPTSSLTQKKVGPIVTIAMQSFAWKQFGAKLSKLLTEPEPETAGQDIAA